MKEGVALRHLAVFLVLVVPVVGYGGPGGLLVPGGAGGGIAGTAQIPGQSDNSGITVSAHLLNSDGVPLSGLELAKKGGKVEEMDLQAAGIYTTATDSQGNFRLGSLPEGNYAVMASNSDKTKAAACGPVRVEGGGDTTVSLQLGGTGQIVGYLRFGGALTGNSGTAVFAEGTAFEGVTGENGYFTIANVPVGTYTVRAVRETYSPFSQAGVVVTEAASTDLAYRNLTRLTRSTAGTAAVASRCGASVLLVSILDEKDAQVRIASGFVVAPELVATCYHVVTGGVAARVKTAEGIVHPVSGVVACSRERDLAIVRVPRLDYLTSLTLRDVNSVQVGEAVVALGSPLGLEGSVSDGVVSPIRELEGLGQVLQTSAPVSPGSSGGPLLDAEGLVIGVISRTNVAGQNLNFAIPASTLAELMTNLADSPTPVGELPSRENLLTEIGLLSPAHRSLKLAVPKAPPHTVMLPPYHRFLPETVRVAHDKEVFKRVQEATELAAGRYVLTQLGVLKFDSTDKGKSVTVEFDYLPYRTAVSTPADDTGGDLRSILEGKLKQIGDEPVVGAEVDAAVAKLLQTPDANPRDLAVMLDCARLVSGTLVSLKRDSGHYLLGHFVAVSVEVTVTDLNTGRQIWSQSATQSGDVTAFRGWRGYRRQLAERCVNAILKGLVGE